MSKQIKIIWILSLVSVLLLIGLQGYWLINQYGYVLNAYAEETALRVLQAGEEEFLNRSRKGDNPSRTSFMIRSNQDSSMFKSHIIIGAQVPETPFANDGLYLPSEQKQYRATLRSPHEGDSQWSTEGIRQIEQEIVINDTTQYNANFFTNLTGDELRSAIERTITNMSTHFDQAQFDSILASTQPELVYTIVPWQQNELFNHSELWKRTGNLFEPALTVSYAYSPLENLGVFVYVKLPAQSVLYRMGIQLIVSVSLVLLLIFCLIFQGKTILKQKKVNEIRENFVNTMVHELKRPVQTLKTFVSFLKDKTMRSDAEATEQVVRDAMFELDNLSAYLNKLKDMLQVDDETTSLHPVRFNLHDLVEKVIRLTHIPPGKGVNITPVYEVDDFYMEADPIHFANVLSNLIENAIKYSGDKVNIEIKIGQDKRKIRISVKDDGIGIPVTEQERVFMKFYRGNNIPDKSIPGIGLGLSYVKLIIEAHQGTINLNSQAGEGTVVTIYLPA